MLQVEVDWDKIKAKVDMELQKEAARPGAKPYNGWWCFHVTAVSLMYMTVNGCF